MKIQLIDEWKRAHKLLSTWVAMFWALIIGIVADDPSALITAWNTLPEDLRADVPHWARVAILSCIAFGTWLGARVIKQRPQTPPQAKS